MHLTYTTKICSLYCPISQQRTGLRILDNEIEEFNIRDTYHQLHQSCLVHPQQCCLWPLDGSGWRRLRLLWIFFSYVADEEALYNRTLLLASKPFRWRTNPCCREESSASPNFRQQMNLFCREEQRWTISQSALPEHYRRNDLVRSRARWKPAQRTWRALPLSLRCWYTAHRRHVPRRAAAWGGFCSGPGKRDTPVQSTTTSLLLGNRSPWSNCELRHCASKRATWPCSARRILVSPSVLP